MLLSRIPVRVLADNPHEYQAVSDVLASGQAGVLALAGAQEAAVVALLCPSAHSLPDDSRDLPCVVLGPERAGAVKGDMPMCTLGVPAHMRDIIDALEAMAHTHADVRKPRHYKGWHLEPAALKLTGPDLKPIPLTDTEARLMAALFDAETFDANTDADNGGLTREVLLNRVWGYRPGLDTHTLETHIYRLRQKIEPNPAAPVFLLTTETGYRLS